MGSSPGWLRRLGQWLDRGDGSPEPWRALAIVATAYLVFVVTYLPINEFSVGRRAAVLYLPGEERIPFVPEFEFIYILGYLLPVVAVLLIPNVRNIVRMVTAFLLTLCIAYATYLVFPVYLERPILEVDSPATLLLSLEYMDRSYNHFPSLHVAFVWLGYFACRKGLRRPAVFILSAIAVSAATLFIKQHYLVDVLYGLALAAAAWLVSDRILGLLERGHAGGVRP
jgi:membrane-associated phospholipid phosphatase